MTARLTRLPNGIRVVSETRRTLQSVAVGVWVDVGARHEAEALNGITHCLEHMVFKGTKRRSARDIAFEIEAVGGHLNAYTSREQTTFYARVMRDDLPLALDLLSDILLYSELDPAELTREQEVIVQEIGQANDTPDDIVFDYLQEACFKAQPLGRSILGTEETVRSFTRESLIGHIDRHYVGRNMVVSAVGSIDHDEFVQAVEAAFGHVKAGEARTDQKAHFVGGKHLDVRDLEQVHLTLGWGGPSFHDDDYYPMQLYSTVLGGGMSSRLFQEVREKRGLVYSVYSFASSHADTGMFGIYAGTGPEMAEELLPVIRGEIEKLATDLPETELNVARAQLKAGLVMGMEATTSRMEQLARQILLFDRIIPVDEILGDIDAVTPEAVQAVAQRIAEEKTPAMAVIGDSIIEKMQY